ncbi:MULTISPECIES: YitT family protein [unclassified Mucilaginibacter]|uniref:YitT family protein n=1 Tax=unclassified Mucilaginibacter TaxID=2617802 RepID=UPI002AC99F53|nr:MULTISPECIES: YitT family protein [unclassified Mucilaginibacter]MEB0262184.1 YitT family protein [Mucilaginibacter sp. 10I4]MEB0277044.1 YitT family protein [Mucilaginibacter sp. 10B2]MEB0302643.1 YitT family protein [Mucilaginibacter sp. 5C4]WPX25145.1 YitT family protein [Mucilaginibacter sp. 5C4]
MKFRGALVDTLLIILGILAAGMGLKGFLLSSHFIDGGVTGISMLLAASTNTPLSVLIFVINIPFLILGYRKLGLLFALKSAAAIAGLSLCIAFVDFPDVTHDKLLTAIFGGAFIGAGIGMAIRGGAVLDGTEIAALLVSKKTQIVRVSDVILILNVVIFTVAVFILGVIPALYSILTYLAASKMIDFILNGLEQYTGMTIVSTKGEEIRLAITQKLGRGVTVYQGKSGYGKDGHINSPREIIFTVATRLEVPLLKKEVLRIDPAAFIVQQSVDDTTGGLLKKKKGH